MIHSLAGGELQNEKVCDIAKVKILDSDQTYFYICDQKFKVGDKVLVPFGKLDELAKAEILRIDNNVNSKNFPIKFDNLKHIAKRLK